MKIRHMLAFACVFACIACPALAQEGAATLPEGPGWAAEAWRTWCGIAGFAIPIAVLLTNTVEPAIRDRWPLAAQRIRQLGPLALSLFMARSMKDALRAVVVAVTQANKPDTLNVQTAETPTAVVTVAVATDATAAPKSKPVLVAGAGLVMMAFALVGCAGLPPEVTKPIADLSVSIQAQDEALRAVYTTLQEECADEQCTRDLELEWDPIIGYQQRIRAAILCLKGDPAACALVLDGGK